MWRLWQEIGQRGCGFGSRRWERERGEFGYEWILLYICTRYIRTRSPLSHLCLLDLSL